MICPVCKGNGGFTDYWGGYSECSLCKESGEITEQQATEYLHKIEMIDRQIEADMRGEEMA